MTSFASSMSAPGLRWRSGYWYSDPFVPSASNTQPVTGITMYAPLFVSHRVVLSHAAVFCGATGPDIMSVRLYRVSDDHMLAWAITDAVSTSATSVGVLKLPLPRQPVIAWPGLYLVAVRFEDMDGLSTWRLAALAANAPALGAYWTLSPVRIVRYTHTEPPGDVVHISALMPENAVPYWVGFTRF